MDAYNAERLYGALIDADLVPDVDWATLPFWKQHRWAETAALFVDGSTCDDWGCDCECHGDITDNEVSPVVGASPSVSEPGAAAPPTKRGSGEPGDSAA
jgi:hypothetical protein